MVTLIASTILGTLGGLIRALFGLQKAIEEKRKILWRRFLFTVFLAMVTGAIIGWTLPENHPILIFLAGAAGPYLIEHSWGFLKFAAVKIGG